MKIPEKVQTGGLDPESRRKLNEVIDYLRDEAVAPYAPVHPMPTRIVPEPRHLPGETVGEFWARTGQAAGWPDKNVVPLTSDEEATS